MNNRNKAAIVTKFITSLW